MGYTVNQRVAIYRKMANLTQTEAAERLGMKCSTYSQMERKGHISVDKLRDPMELTSEQSRPVEQPAAPAKPEMPIFREPVVAPTSRPAFVISRNEENMLTILRNLPKADLDEVRSLINEKYQNSKKKK